MSPAIPLTPSPSKISTPPAQSSTPTLPSPPCPPPSPSSLAIHSLSLNEPPKATILNWRPGDTFLLRPAAIIARFHGDPHVLSVDLSSCAVTHHPIPASGFPTMNVDDMTSSIWPPHANPAFNHSVLALGFYADKLGLCALQMVGNFCFALLFLGVFSFTISTATYHPNDPRLHPTSKLTTFLMSPPPPPFVPMTPSSTPARTSSAPLPPMTTPLPPSASQTYQPMKTPATVMTRMALSTARTQRSTTS